MQIFFLFRQLDITFLFCDVDISTVSVRKAVEEIEAAESTHAPFDTGLGTNRTDKLMSVFLLILRRIECIDKFYP